MATTASWIACTVCRGREVRTKGTCYELHTGLRLVYGAPSPTLEACFFSLPPMGLSRLLLQALPAPCRHRVARRTPLEGLGLRVRSSRSDLVVFHSQTHTAERHQSPQASQKAYDSTGESPKRTYEAAILGQLHTSR